MTCCLFALVARGAAEGGGAVRVVAAPPAEWVDRWLAPSDARARQLGGRTPSDWFIDATEALGDAALAQVAAPPGTRARLEELERCLSVVADHEFVLQHLADAARALARHS